MTTVGIQAGEKVNPTNSGAGPRKLIRGVPLRVQFQALPILTTTSAATTSATKKKRKKRTKNQMPIAAIVRPKTMQKGVEKSDAPDQRIDKPVEVQTAQSISMSADQLLAQEESPQGQPIEAGHQCPYCLKRFSLKTRKRHMRACRQQAANLTMKCPLCELSFQAIMLPAHMTRSHGKTFGTPGNLPVRVEYVDASASKPPRDGKVRCKFCEVLLPPDAIDQHMERFHTSSSEWTPPGDIRKFSFILLPPSKDGIRTMIERYRNLSSAHPYSFADAHFDWERLERIENYNPSARYVGTKSWKGYVVFEFQHSDKVILECPRTGNATYILTGNWRNMISETKADLRSEFSHLCTRIIHCADWERQVRRTVFNSKPKVVKAVVSPIGS